MTHVVEIDKPLNPMAIGLLGSSAVMAGAQGFPETIQKFWLLGSPRGIAWMAYRCTRTDVCGTSLLHGLLPSLKAVIDYHLLYRAVKEISKRRILLTSVGIPLSFFRFLPKINVWDAAMLFDLPAGESQYSLKLR